MRVGKGWGQGMGGLANKNVLSMVSEEFSVRMESFRQANRLPLVSGNRARKELIVGIRWRHLNCHIVFDRQQTCVKRAVVEGREQ